jgi:peptidoglycan/LPS O-acetylase OafA/YrhL
VKIKLPSRQLHIDALKFLASQLIVLHHLIAYGPISDAVSQAAPGVADWFFGQTRMAVQVFLVLGGYLAAKGLSPQGRAWDGSPLSAMGRRYLRLVLPCLVALVLAVASAALTRLWLTDEFIPAAPTWLQGLAHVLLMQGLLGQDALSAGIWYVSIDFQLFALIAVLLWLAHKVLPSTARAGSVGAGVAQTLVLGLMLCSLFFFNRDARWDNWAVYFFGSYGMGAAAYWVGCSRRPSWYLGMLTLSGLVALLADFRERIGLALAVALLLGLFLWLGQSQRSPWLPERLRQMVSTMGALSYALFLVHFPVLMLCNAVFAGLGLSSPWAGCVFLLASWLASLGAAVLFERWVEAPLDRRIRLAAMPA